MKRRQTLTLAITGVAGIFLATMQRVVAQTTPSATTSAINSPTTAPATQPGASAGIDDLIRQLGNSEADQREDAQHQLVARGSLAVAALKKAAEHDEDLEIRSRATAALTEIVEHEAFDATPITLHLKDVPVQDALTALGGQAHAQFAGMAPGLPAGPVGKLLSIDADQKPFWDVMTDICQQTNLCPVLDTPTKNVLRLFPTPRNWMTQSPHKIVGPYWFGVAGIYRTRTIDTMGPEKVDDQFTMRFIVYPEPKLAVTQISEFNLKEATDDAGNSLLPNAAAAPINAIGRLGMALTAARSSRQTLRTVETRLGYPAHPGNRIKSLRGDVVVTLAEGVQQFIIDDVLGAAKQTNPVNHCKIKITVAANGPALYRVAVECTRDGLLDEQWAAITNRINDITLEDEDGKVLTPYPYSSGVMSSDSTFTSTTLFSKNVFNGQLLNGQVTGQTKDPKRLTWNIATRLKPVTVPISFTDLPMP